MQCRWMALACVSVGLLLASSAQAQSTGKKRPAASSTEAAPEESPKPEAKKGPGRKDPNGVTGISPYTELLNQGNASYIARDYVAAASSYQEAVRQEPQLPLGHYLLGQALLAQNKLDEAGRTWQAGLRYAERNPVIRAKLLFVIADLRERQQRWDEAVSAWAEYRDFVAANPKANGYSTSGSERGRALDSRKELAAKYAVVRDRIQQRLQESGAAPK